MRKLIGLALLALAGCDYGVIVQNELPKYVGRPVTDLIAKLGHPTSEETVAGRHAYVWFSRKGATCTLRAFVDAGVVQDIDGEGGAQSCSVFADALTRH